MSAMTLVLSPKRRQRHPWRWTLAALGLTLATLLGFAGYVLLFSGPHVYDRSCPPGEQRTVVHAEDAAISGTVCR